MEDRLPILNQNNISAAEYLVMCTVGYHIFLPPAELAQVSKNLSAGDALGEFTLVEYQQAVASCLTQKWLEVVTPEQHEQMIVLGQAAGVPEIIDYPAPQTVDFTPQGYALFRQVIRDIFGEAHLQQSDAGWHLDEVGQVAHIYAETLAWCHTQLQQFTADPSSYVGETAEIKEAGEVKAIGAWKPNRFITLPHGFYVRVQYKIIEG